MQQEQIKRGNNMDIKFIENNTDAKIEYYKEISSTSERAKAVVEEIFKSMQITNKEYSQTIEKNINDIRVIISEKQTNGKGTNGRVWLSNDSENILMTLIFFPHKKANEIQEITYSIAEMIKAAIKELYNISLDIKLPNDLLLSDKKICGILTESSIQNDKVKYLLIGIGFNVNQLEFPNEITNIATSLKKENKDKAFSREEIIVKIINNVKSLMI